MVGNWPKSVRISVMCWRLLVERGAIFHVKHAVLTSR
jgi:hypothetical protein